MELTNYNTIVLAYCYFRNEFTFLCAPIGNAVWPIDLMISVQKKRQTIQIIPTWLNGLDIFYDLIEPNLKN